MDRELTSLLANNTWEEAEALPQGRTAIGSKWVFKRKYNSEGVRTKHKARLVAQGFSQRYGLDYTETFSPVAKLSSIRTLMALSVKRSMATRQMDIETAYLHGELKVEVYMRRPEGLDNGRNHFVRLKTALYGLK